MHRSEITVDLGALRRNVARLRAAAGDAEVWAVVKADAYGHGAPDIARAALDAGARALCVATVSEGARLRAAVGDARILVMGPFVLGEEAVARDARLELAVSHPEVPGGIPVHLKVDTGMGRYGMAVEEALDVAREGRVWAMSPDQVPGRGRRGQVVGLMSHLATADEADDAFAREQIARFAALAERFDGVTRHIANSAATLRFAESRFDAVRCGIAVYGLSPFGVEPARDGLEPVLAWRSYVAKTRMLRAGESTGYGRRFVAARPTRVGLVPVGYADGFRRGLTGTEVVVDGARRRVVGTVSMDSFAVELEDEPEGASVTLIGDGVLAEEHARVLDTINYEITCGVRADPARAIRTVLDG